MPDAVTKGDQGRLTVGGHGHCRAQCPTDGRKQRQAGQRGDQRGGNALKIETSVAPKMPSTR